MASLNDQFEYGRIPIKPLPYKDRNLSQCNEIMVDYGEDANYHIYITHHNDPDKYIDITALIVKEMLPKAEINANQFTVTIEGNEHPQSLMDLLNYIWKRFTYAEDPSGFDPVTDTDLLYNPTTVSVLLQTTDGQIQLPITIADNVYDKNGNSIQSILDGMTRLAFSVSYIYCTQDDQTSFEFEYPFEDYPDMLEVRIGTTYVDRTRYQIEKHYDLEGHFKTGTIHFPYESIEKGRRIDLVWIFNSYDEGSSVKFMSGSKIADSTIPITKLEMYSDSYNYANGNSVATSKALANLYADLTSAINANNQNLFHCPDISLASNIIEANIGRSAKEGDVIIATTATSKTAAVKLLVNGTNYNIKTPDGNAITRGFRNNQVIKFKISDNKAIILSGISGEIRSNKYIYDCEDQEYIIPFGGLAYDNGDLVHVYRNGVRLFQDLDYSVDTANETITLFVRTEQGERIVFESLGV